MNHAVWIHCTSNKPNENTPRVSHKLINPQN
jgi:hypothetical protein